MQVGLRTRRTRQSLFVVGYAHHGRQSGATHRRSLQKRIHFLNLFYRRDAGFSCHPHAVCYLLTYLFIDICFSRQKDRKQRKLEGTLRLVTSPSECR